MRVFIAGATGVIGIRLVKRLTANGHTVAGMTRTSHKANLLRELGASPVIGDIFERSDLTNAVATFHPDLLMHQVTDLPDHLEQLQDFASRNDRVRTEGTANLLAAAAACGVGHFLGQSIAWLPAGREQIIADHERQILDASGVVVRYGQLYGPDTFYPNKLPPPPRVHVDTAARRTIPLIAAPSQVLTIADEAT